MMAAPARKLSPLDEVSLFIEDECAKLGVERSSLNPHRHRPDKSPVITLSAAVPTARTTRPMCFQCGTEHASKHGPDYPDPECPLDRQSWNDFRATQDAYFAAPTPETERPYKLAARVLEFVRESWKRCAACSPSLTKAHGVWLNGESKPRCGWCADFAGRAVAALGFVPTVRRAVPVNAAPQRSLFGDGS